MGVGPVLPIIDQPADSDLTAIAALATTTYGRSLLTTADVDALATAIATRTALSSRYAPLRLPTNAKASTMSRASYIGNTTSGIVTGYLNWTAIDLAAGEPVTSITFVSGSTAAGSPTNQWFALADSNRLVLAVTADDTTTAWTPTTAKTLTVASGPFVPTYSGLHYVGFMVTATTMPSLLAASGPNAVGVTQLTPLASFQTNGPFTTPAGLVGTTVAANAMLDPQYYAFVS